jgi:hypothetical protein
LKATAPVRLIDQRDTKMSSLKITIAAAAFALTAFGAATAAAKPMFQPVNPSMQPIGGNSMYKPVNPSFQPIGKVPGGCGKGFVGCNPSTWTPGSHGFHGGFGGLDVTLAVGQSTVVVDDGCYYVHRKVFVSNVGMVRERVLVCD